MSSGRVKLLRADEVATGPLDQERLCAVAGQVLAALGVAHDSGLIHRDIKPGNVLLAEDGTAKLADFGIAKVVEKNIEKNDDATTGFLLGTPAYLAPERLAGHPATPASDLYAVGVVLYEALTGRKPKLRRRRRGPSPVPSATVAPPLTASPCPVLLRPHQGRPPRMGTLMPVPVAWAAPCGFIRSTSLKLF
ncbi:MAG TPA: serine/threonine-protein kinase [Acidimicrobiales bacterium]|nr:serine/threonine-protein kinase [Acidimicrobiales bacterium]